jgi:predicted nucleotide-binding protein
LAKINQKLIDRIADDFGITARAVYPHITRVANETMLDRHLAALVLASRRHINIHKYSTPAERAEIRNVTRVGGGQEPEPDRGQPTAAPLRRAVKAAKKKAARKAKGNKVFVVHGRDDRLRKSMFDFLRALDLAPYEWQHALDQAKGNNPYVGDVIDEVMDQAVAVVVMFSPDDLVQLKEQLLKPDDGPIERKPQGQARPNVLFEAGLAMGRHPGKTVLVRVGRVKAFSDVGGRHIASLGEDFDSRNDFANRLQKAGCPVNRIGNDWAKTGLFEPTEPKAAKKKPLARALAG